MGQDQKFYQNLEYLNVFKPALDTKAINPTVLSMLHSELEQNKRVRVLDCGTGTGSSLIGLIENGVLKEADIQAFDIDSELVADMPRLFQQYATRKGYHYESIRYDKKDDFSFGIADSSKGIDIKVHGFSEDVYGLIRRESELRGIDLITGQSFIEHVNPGMVYPTLMTLLNEEGLVYFSMNCDGWFNYSPSKDRERDEKIVGLFNDLAMNNQRFNNNYGSIFTGEAFCGRNLPYRFSENGLEILAYGTSDWVVTPFKQSNEEMGFIKYTLDKIFESCSGLEELIHENTNEIGGLELSPEKLRKKYSLSEEDITTWYIEKLKAIEDGREGRRIGFTCVQKDILGKKIKSD